MPGPSPDLLNEVQRFIAQESLLFKSFTEDFDLQPRLKTTIVNTQ